MREEKSKMCKSREHYEEVDKGWLQSLCSTEL